MDLLPPRWADVTDEITELLASIAHQIHALDRLHQKHILPAFNDDEAKREEEGQIEQLTQTITRSFHQCQKAIKRIEAMLADAHRPGAKPGSGMSRAEEQMARNIQVSLASRVQEASAGFRKKQSAYLKSMSAVRTLGFALFGERWASRLPELQRLSSLPFD